MKFKKIIGKLIWNVSEGFNIPLGRFECTILAWYLSCNSYKKVK